MSTSSPFTEGHPLLEARGPSYSNATVRRAFIVWMHCGQKNSFKDVCNYYHYLEIMENKLPAAQRASSRHLEFNMFSTPPPTSPYLNQVFPKLYTLNHIHHYIRNVNIKNDTAFSLDALAELKTQNSVTTQEILNTSNIIRKYCRSHMMTIRKFLTQFKEYAKKCELNYTVSNVSFYIKRKLIEEELQMVENYAKTLHFLNLNDENSDKNDLKRLFTLDFGEKFELKMNVNDKNILEKNSQEITILTKDKREKIIQLWSDFSSNFTETNKSFYTRN